MVTLPSVWAFEVHQQHHQCWYLSLLWQEGDLCCILHT